MTCNDMQWPAMTCNDLQKHAKECWLAMTCKNMQRLLTCNHLQRLLTCNHLQRLLTCNHLQNRTVRSKLAVMDFLKSCFYTFQPFQQRHWIELEKTSKSNPNMPIFCDIGIRTHWPLGRPLEGSMGPLIKNHHGVRFNRLIKLVQNF